MELAKLAAQLKSLRAQVEKAHSAAEADMEKLEEKKGVTPQELEEQTGLLERLESVLECLEEALDHCEGV